MRDLYVLGSIMWEFTLYLFNLSRDLAPKYLTGLTLWSILQGGNFAPQNELCP